MRMRVRLHRDMSISQEIAAIESRLHKSGLTLSAFLKVAGVNSSMWQRWRSGQDKPMLDSWRRIEAAERSIDP